MTEAGKECKKGGANTWLRGKSVTSGVARGGVLWALRGGDRV